MNISEKAQTVVDNWLLYGGPLKDLIAQALTETSPIARWTGKMPSGEEMWEMRMAARNSTMFTWLEELRDDLLQLFQSQQVERERLLCEEQRKACAVSFKSASPIHNLLSDANIEYVRQSILSSPLPPSVRETEKPKCCEKCGQVVKS